MITEERQLDRINKKLLIKADGQTCVVTDMSKNGIHLIIPGLLKKQIVDIHFQMDNLILEMKGFIRWIKKEPTVYEQVQYQVGLSLIDPPEEYISLIDSLLNE